MAACNFTPFATDVKYLKFSTTRDPIQPNFMFQRAVANSPAKLSLRCQICRGFPSHKKIIFLTMRMKYLTFPWWNKTAVLAGQPSTGH